MEPSTPFVDRESGQLNVEQIIGEAVPVGKLVGLFVAVALVPILFAVLTGGIFGGLMFLIAQFVLAIGSALTLMYIIVRALQIADQQTARAGTAPRAATGTSSDGEADADTSGGDAAAGGEAGDQGDAAAAEDGADAEADEDGEDEEASEESDEDGEAGEDGDDE